MDKKFGKIVNHLGLNKFYNYEMKKNLISFYDPSIGSQNIGDEIIAESGYEIINQLFKEEQIIKFPTHTGIKSIGLTQSNRSKIRFLCGSNLLQSNMHLILPNQFVMSLFDFLKSNKFLLFGIGWQSYRKEISFYSKKILPFILDNYFMHSVRDDYTKNQLNSIGINNIINTGCPTMWKFTKEFCKTIESDKAEKVVFTLNSYVKNFDYDKKMINTLCTNYNDVFFWPQGAEDLKYFKQINRQSKIKIIPAKLSSFVSFLNENKIDYIGKRLHGGIKALQLRKRTIIIGIDNRAIEKKKDFNLPVVLEENGINALEKEIGKKINFNIKLKNENIKRWKEQFLYE